MCTASVQLIIEGSRRLAQDTKYFRHQHDNSSKYSLHDIDMTPIPITSMVLSIGKNTRLVLNLKSNDLKFSFDVSVERNFVCC